MMLPRGSQLGQSPLVQPGSQEGCGSQELLFRVLRLILCERVNEINTEVFSLQR